MDQDISGSIQKSGVWCLNSKPQYLLNYSSPTNDSWRVQKKAIRAFNLIFETKFFFLAKFAEFWINFPQFFLLFLERFVLKEAHDYCGSSLGFARTKKTSEFYERCLFCRKGVKIRNWGLSTYAEYCGGAKHYRLYCLYSLEKSLPLRNRNGSLLIANSRRLLTMQFKGVACPNFEKNPFGQWKKCWRWSDQVRHCGVQSEIRMQRSERVLLFSDVWL